MPDSRQLAVIMFTDIVGYSAIMQQNEAMALSKLNRFKEVLIANVNKHEGTIIQYYGDGSLVTFKNSQQAVICAAAIQTELQEEPNVPVRIGIHLGDILYREGNIFGNCVNVASRIESMGVAGSVLLSEPVQEQLKNKPDFKVTSLGSFLFKNIDIPMEVFALLKDGLPVPARNELQGKFRENVRNSIAVLPFVNMSNDPEQEYFSDGMAEEIINSITHLKDLNVAGRTSSFQFKGKNLDLRQIGKKLGVSTVLEGSVRKQGNRLRITAQLINVEDGYHIWSEKFDRQLNDVFAIQDEIALAISEKLLVTVLKKDRALITKTHTLNTEAYELYLKGRFYCSRRGAALITGMKYFQKAIETDPDFALAHSGYAEAFMLLATYGLLQPNKAMINARESAEKALQLDPLLCEPYCTLGYYYTCYEWNWEKAKKHFLKSVDLNPRYAEGQLRYGWTYLTCVEGNFTEAEIHGKKGIQLEPLSSICFANHALILHCAEKYEEALACCKTGIDLDANSFVCHLNAGSVYHAMKQYDNAISSFKSAMNLSNRHSFAMNALIWTYCKCNEFEKATELLMELKQRSKTEYIGSAICAVSHAYLGQMDESIHKLEQALIEKDPMLLLLKYESWVPDQLRIDNRFLQILEKIGFPEVVKKDLSNAAREGIDF